MRAKLASLKLPDLRKVRLALLKLEGELPHDWSEPQHHPTMIVAKEVRAYVVLALKAIEGYYARVESGRLSP